jgi:hypothetical protein
MIFMKVVFKIALVLLILASITYLVTERRYIKELIFKNQTWQQASPTLEPQEEEQNSSQMGYKEAVTLPISHLELTPQEDAELKDSKKPDYKDQESQKYQPTEPQPLKQHETINIREESAATNCKLIFISLNNIFVKFFQKQDFSSDASLLQSATKLPADLYSQINQVKDRYSKAKQNNVVQNKIAAKMIYIENSADHEKEFLQDAQKLQEYFYSPNFLSNCKS